jgi:hypothetical protein
MLALVLFALATALYLSRNSLAPWTFWLAGLTWLLMFLFVLLPATLSVLAELAGF